MEVLYLEYSAMGRIRVVVPAMTKGKDPQGNDIDVVLQGATPPETTLTLEEFLDEAPELISEFQLCLAKLEPFARTRATKPVTDPNAVQALANKNAADKVAIAEQQKALEQATSDAQAATAKADADRIKNEKAAQDAADLHAKLTAEIAQMQAVVTTSEESAKE